MIGFKNYVKNRKIVPNKHFMGLRFHEMLHETNFGSIAKHYETHNQTHKIVSKIHHIVNQGSLSPEHEKSLYYYSTSSGCKTINGDLWQYGPKSPCPDTNNISDAISRSKVKRNITVFSGMRSPEDLKPRHDGLIHLRNPSFTSTSFSPITAKSFSKTQTFDKSQDSEHSYFVPPLVHVANEYDGIKPYEKYDPHNPVHVNYNHKFVSYHHVVKIHVPAGSHAIHVSPYSEFKGEHELLLHHGIHVGIKQHPKIDHSTRTVLWHGNLLHDGIQPTKHGVNGSYYPPHEVKSHGV